MHLRSKVLLPALLVLLGTSLVGCMHSRDLSGTMQLLEAEHEELALDREMNLNLGFFSLRTLGLLSRLGGSELDEARALLPYLKRVKVGVYNVTGSYPERRIDFPNWERLQKQGWEPAVRHRAPDETTWVLYRERRDAVRELYLFHLDQEQLVLLRLRGDFNRLLAHILSDRENFTADLRRLSVSN